MKTIKTKAEQRQVLANAVDTYLANTNNIILRYRTSKRRPRWMFAGQKNAQRPVMWRDLI